MSDRWQTVERLFTEAAELAGAERAAFLEDACLTDGAPDPDLRREVERMLALDDEATVFFEDAARLPTPVDRSMPERVGLWKILGRVGEGGMGEVFEAVRADGTYQRRAAVKVVRPGLAPDVLTRFRAERHLLARLDHPAIARLLDGGTAGDGRPYLALEFVDGVPITGYADARRLGLEARLGLFAQVCDAVAYAHRQLVVHRDLKPSNVMVTGEGRVKLLDFGIAKILDPEDATFTIAMTGTNRLLMTPEYAAPEQVRGEPATTATDVYGLGVLLFELLTGARPYGAHTSRRAAERAVLEDDPPDPSTVAGTSGLEVAAARSSDPARLRRQLRGDLDRIVRKALRKEPERRYDGAGALVADVRRYLEGLPVEARPDSAAYRVGKFVRRHRVGAAATAAAVLAMIAGLGAVSWQARIAATERDSAEAVATFMTALLSEFDPNRSAGGALDAADVLDVAAARIEDELDGEPAVQARLLDAIGQINQSYARFEPAERSLRAALEIRTRMHGPRHPDVARSLYNLAWLDHVRGDYLEADSLYRLALEVQRETSGMDDPRTAATIEGLGLLARVNGDLEGAEQLLRQALEIREAALPLGHPERVSNLNALAALLSEASRPDEAEPLFREVVEVRRRTLGTHVQTAQSLNDYAALLTAREEYTSAQGLYIEGLQMRRILLGSDHPHVAQSLSHVGWSLQNQGRPDAAEPYYREALAIRRKAFGDEHVATANSRLMLGEVRYRQGDVEGGLAEVEQAVKTFVTVLGPLDRSTLSARLRAAEIHAEIGETREVQAFLASFGPALADAFGPDSDRARRANVLRSRSMMASASR